jgi:hypothetical protein
LREGFKQDYKIDCQLVQAVGLALEMCDPVPHGCIYDRIVMRPMGDERIAAFEKVLIDAAFVVEYLKRRLSRFEPSISFDARHS